MDKLEAHARPCGGCGAKSNAERCIGCLHDFGTPESAWVRKYHRTAAPDGPEAEITRLKGEVERLTEALTASEATKAAYICEFSVPWVEIGEDGGEYTRRITVPWTTIKEIMAAILARSSGKAGSDA